MDEIDNLDPDDWPEPWVNLGHGEARFFQPRAQFQVYWMEYMEKLKYKLPTDEELLRRWWRQQFVFFLQRQLKKNGYPKQKWYEMGTIEYMFELYPWMKEPWTQHVNKKVPFIPLTMDLRRRWWSGKRHDFLMRWMRGARNKYQPKKFMLNLMVKRLVWCHHKECWYLRINSFVALLMLLLLLYVTFYL